MTTATMARARAGDADAFGELTEPYRRELQAHCYRLLGSAHDAEDIVQETLLAAWRGLSGFEERSSVRTWLYKIATNRCLNALRAAGRRPAARVPAPHLGAPAPSRRPEPLWLEPYPDALIDDLADAAPGPEARYEAKEALALAFVTGLAQLPPRQRAVLVLRDVLGYRSAEAAELLDSSDISVNSALQRARATMGGLLPADRDRAPAPRSARERQTVGAFVDAFVSADIERLVALLADEASLTMPPQPVSYEGRAAIAEFFGSLRWWGTQAVELLPVRANGQPAFGYYLTDPVTSVARLNGLFVLTLDDESVSGLTRFASDALIGAFDLPSTRPQTSQSA